MSDDRLVREIWKQLPHRAVVGDRLVSRVGGRGWRRPRFAKFARYFERCGLPDPWDPDGKAVDIGLGDVGFGGDTKRQVAPHLAPPPEKAAPKGPQLPNVPNAPKAPPPQGAKLAPQIGEQRRDDTAELKRKMAEKEKAKAQANRPQPKYTVDKPLAKLPVRPDLGEAPPARPATPAASRPAPPASTARPVQAPTRIPVAPVRRVMPDGPEEIEDEPGNFFGAGAVRRGVEGAAPAAELPPPVAAAAHPAAAAADAVAAPASSSGSADSPERPTAASSDAPPKPAGPPPAPNRTPPRPAGGGGLDDMFGMGAGGGDNTRIRIPKRDDGGEAKPRRPMVTSAEDLAKTGFDRRPPPPKPPTVTPTSGGGAAPAPDEGPDE